MSRRLLRLSPEYGGIDTFPVADVTGDPDGPIGELEPDEEPDFSEQLVQELYAWNARAQELVFSDDPVDENDFDYEDELTRWKKEGRSLAKRIEIELGKEIDVHVTYQP